MNFEILIPVWGERYVTQFAEFGLRSLLSPGNVPWLSQNHRVQATILTRADSRGFVEAQPAFRRLADLALTSFVEIDDLLGAYGGNYSVILTRAYNRAMALNRDMLGTAFIYLVGDLVFADGALRAVANAMESGSHACVMCSPRVSAQALAPIFTRTGSTVELTVTNRQMADLLMRHPHPTLIAKVVRDDRIHLSIVHQFFWRPDPDAMVARCFLAHMLCIKPTRRPRDIAAPCDFSYLEELAPNASYHFLTDSDAFLALEMQDAVHEAKYITTFPLEPPEVAESLSAWTTAQHHKYIEATFVFRRGGSAYSQDAGRALTQPYVDSLLAAMPPPMDHRRHFFWLGGVGAPVVTRPWDETARERDLDRIPKVLRRLIEAHLNRQRDRRVDLAICATDGPTPIEALLTVSARVACRVAPRRLHDVLEDIADPGEPFLLVLWGQLDQFLELFGHPSRVYHLLRVAGENRTMLLCFEISPELVRGDKPNRGHLNELFTSSFETFARFGLLARVHDLAHSVFDDVNGFVIEILPDETFAASATPSYSAQDDLLSGRRGDISN
jgi:hypothetical protein